MHRIIKPQCWDFQNGLGGEEVFQYNAIYVVVEPDELSADLPAVAHELTHAVEGQMSFNPYNSLPYWLNEGLAVYVQFLMQLYHRSLHQPCPLRLRIIH